MADGARVATMKAFAFPSNASFNAAFDPYSTLPLSTASLIV